MTKETAMAHWLVPVFKFSYFRILHLEHLIWPKITRADWTLFKLPPNQASLKSKRLLKLISTYQDVIAHDNK